MLCIFNLKKYLKDVSDRLEKESVESVALQLLETGGKDVYGEDWRSCISDEVAADLRKYRSYRGDSVRDLLRAFRNKVCLRSLFK